MGAMSVENDMLLLVCIMGSAALCFPGRSYIVAWID